MGFPESPVQASDTSPADVSMTPAAAAENTAPKPKKKSVAFTKSATRKAAAAPALAYLNGEKVPIGDFLALLVGKNEFM